MRHCDSLISAIARSYCDRAVPCRPPLKSDLPRPCSKRLQRFCRRTRKRHHRFRGLQSLAELFAYAERDAVERVEQLGASVGSLLKREDFGAALRGHDARRDEINCSRCASRRARAPRGLVGGAQPRARRTRSAGAVATAHHAQGLRDRGGWLDVGVATLLQCHHQCVSQRLEQYGVRRVARHIGDDDPVARTERRMRSRTPRERTTRSSRRRGPRSLRAADEIVCAPASNRLEARQRPPAQARLVWNRSAGDFASAFPTTSSSAAGRSASRNALVEQDRPRGERRPSGCRAAIGAWPVIISYSTSQTVDVTPMVDARRVCLLRRLMYAGVLSAMPDTVIRSSAARSSACAMPKSETTARPESMRIFSGLMSRWTTPIECA